MSIKTSDLGDVKGGVKLLDPNVYDWKITKAEQITREKNGETLHSLMARVTCIGGPAQTGR